MIHQFLLQCAISFLILDADAAVVGVVERRRAFQPIDL
jgi:hypothetical protein